VRTSNAAANVDFGKEIDRIILVSVKTAETLIQRKEKTMNRKLHGKAAALGVVVIATLSSIPVKSTPAIETGGTAAIQSASSAQPTLVELAADDAPTGSLQGGKSALEPRVSDLKALPERTRIESLCRSRLWRHSARRDEARRHCLVALTRSGITGVWAGFSRMDS
jgi:hypothetical protein